MIRPKKNKVNIQFRVGEGLSGRLKWERGWNMEKKEARVLAGVLRKQVPLPRTLESVVWPHFELSQ